MAIATTEPELIVEPHQPKPHNSSRLALLDLARLLAAYAIVWLHTPRSPALAPWSVLGRFAVPFFTAAAVFFVIDSLHRQPHRPLLQYTANRFRRIYLPFLGWSGIYLVFKAIKAAALPDQPNQFPGIEVFWTGTFFHLWFMPFILAATLITFVLGRKVVGHANREWLSCTLALLGGLAIALVDPPSWVATDTGFALLAWNTLPAACWGWALAICFPHGVNQTISSRIVTAFAAAGFVGLVWWLAAFGRNTLIENLAGMLFLIVALQPSSPKWVDRVARFGLLAYGIYLSHLLLIKVMEAIATKLHVPVSCYLDLAVFVVAIMGSTALAWVLARSPRTRWLVG